MIFHEFEILTIGYKVLYELRSGQIMTFDISIHDLNAMWFEV